MSKFERQIKQFNDKALDRAKRTFRGSVQHVVNEAQAEQPAGRMRRDTGFLINSGGAGINEMPRGPTENPEGAQVSSRVTGMGLTEALGRWQPGDTFFWGWTAGYSAIRESKDGFMRGAAEKWNSIVASVARRVGR